MTESGTEATTLEGRPVKVAAVVEGDDPPAWIRRVVEDCMSLPTCHLVAILIADTEGPGVSGVGSIIAGRIYRSLDERLFPSEPDAFARADLPVDVPVERGDICLTEDQTVLGPIIMSWVEEREVDVVIGLGVPRLEVACPTPVSLWSLDIGGRSYGSWLEGSIPELVAGRHLVVITLRDSGRTPCLVGEFRRTVTAVHPWSPRLTRNKVMWSSANLISNALRHAVGRVAASPSSNLPLTFGDTGPSGPSRTSTFGFALRHGTRLATHAMVRAAVRDEWHVAYRVRDNHRNFGQGGGYRVLRAPPGHSYADPFLFEHGGEHWLFLEDVVYAKHRGRLVCLCLNDSGGGEMMPVLDKQYHLSYPFVFGWLQDIFMIPESGETGTVDLYRCNSFPDRWERLGPILSGIWGSDATLVEFGDLLWLFVTVARPGMHPSDELHLYFATDLLGPWDAHPRNPIVNDVRAGRSAGRLFSTDGTLVRPSQDSARRYGHAINFQAVTRLTVDDFEESTVGRLEASQLGAFASHTYNFDSRYEAVDLLRPRLRLHR